MQSMDQLREQLAEAQQASELDLFRQGLLEAVNARTAGMVSKVETNFAFVCEVGERLAEAEEFQDFLPCTFEGSGQRGRKLRVDGYERDEADDSFRLLVAEYSGTADRSTLTWSRAQVIFSTLEAFIEDAMLEKVKNEDTEQTKQALDLAAQIRDGTAIREDGTRSIGRFRLYLITDSVLSERQGLLAEKTLAGIPVEFHIWDISRLHSVATSLLGTEEIEIDFTKFLPGGLPCLHAGSTAEFDGYLCVIPGDALAKIYDSYGSRLLEGNVRSFLTSSGKINKGIQATIRKEAQRFFVYNNGISATATSATVVQTSQGARLVSAKYLQIVNGGQTTASLHVAKSKDKADLSSIHVQMKLTVVSASSADMLDTLIQKIAEFSNKQNKVNDADFFSNHPFHRAIERHSRNIKAPAVAGSNINTRWFYERARGQYFNDQSKLNITQKKAFQRENPRSQLITKTDLAKFENSFRQLPYIVCFGAQKNFLVFAKFIADQYGEDGRKFDNDVYFKEAVSRAILFKFTEALVSQARSSWYGGDYRAQIVTYTLGKLVNLLEAEAPGLAINYPGIWSSQRVPPGTAKQIEAIARAVSESITAPPPGYRNVGEWCKKDACWSGVKALPIPILQEFRSELISQEEATNIAKEASRQGADDASINAITEVVRLREAGRWAQLSEWAQRFSPIYGKESDLVRNACRPGWIPSDGQAKALVRIYKRLEGEGFGSTS